LGWHFRKERGTEEGKEKIEIVGGGRGEEVGEEGAGKMMEKRERRVLH
jgi:hypothetical protein